MKRLFIQGAINEFNSQVKCVKFIARQANHIDHVQILKYYSCYSNLGRTGRGQVLSLDKGCLYKRSILGELLLTLGIGKENNRSDRDTHIEMLDTDIPPQYQSQYVKQSPQDFRILGPYDYYSVTHLPQTYYFGNKRVLISRSCRAISMYRLSAMVIA